MSLVRKYLSKLFVTVMLHTSKQDFSLLHPLLFVQELMKKPTIKVPTNKHLERLAELEQTVAEQDISLSSVTEKLNLTMAELEKHRISMEEQAVNHADKISK